MNAGKLEIDLGMNTKEFDEKYAKLEAKLEQEELDLKVKVADLEDTKKELKEVNQELNRIKQKRDEINKTYQSKSSQFQRIDTKISSGESLTPEEYNRYGYLQNTLSGLESQLKKVNSEFDKQNMLVNKATDKVTKAQQQYDKQKIKVEQTTMALSKLNNETEKSGKTSEFNYKKIANGIKKLGFSLIGLRSAYALVSRASSAYLSVDTELAKKLQSVWIGLGAFLQPLLEALSNALLKALGYLNVFVKALTGIDFLARANAKAIKQQSDATYGLAKAQKELTKYDFDVIRTQQDMSSSSGGGGVSADTGSLFDIPELDERVVAKLQDMAKWLKENWNWIKKVGEALLITFGAVKIGQILANIAKLLGGAGSGLIGLSSILEGLLAVGVVTLGVYLLYTAMTGRDLIEDLNNIRIGIIELKKSTENNIKTDKQYTEGLEDLTQKMKDAITTGKLTPDLLKTTTDYLRETTKATAEQVKIINEDMIVTSQTIEEKKELAKQLEKNIEIYELLYEQNKDNNEITEDYKNAIATLIATKISLGEEAGDLMQKYRELNKTTEEAKQETDAFYSSEKDVIDKLNYIGGKQWKFSITADTVQAENSINNFVNRINSKIDKALKLNLNTSGMVGYATGGIVTQPTRAIIGEAGYPEAVVPMTQDYLSTLAQEISKYGGGNSQGGNINIYLDGRLIQRQTQNRENQKNFITNT